MAGMDNKVALVIGGAKGIGLAIADRLAAEGALVFLTGRRADEVKKAAESIGRGARGLVADASVPEDLGRVVATLRDAHGRIDALVLNAGMSEPATLINETPEHFDRHFAVNVRGPVFGLQVALGAMGYGSSVVLVGSITDTAGISPPVRSCASMAACVKSEAADEVLEILYGALAMRFACRTGSLLCNSLRASAFRSWLSIARGHRGNAELIRAVTTSDRMRTAVGGKTSGADFA